jgi:hypothetical protein
VFDQAAAEGIGLRVLTQAIPPELALDAEPAALIAAALAAGSVVVVPERPVNVNGSSRLGWWIVDPRTGSAVDQLDTGGGQVEPPVVITDVVLLQAAFRDAILRYGAPFILGIARAYQNDPQRARVFANMVADALTGG